MLSLALTSSAFAIDFNKVTGTFEVESVPTPIGEDSVAAATFGSFNLTTDKSRSPASVEEIEKATVGINDVTGTFR